MPLPESRPRLAPESQPRLAIVLILTSIGLISVLDTIYKYLTAELHPVQLVWGYFVGIVGFLVLYFAVRRVPPTRLLRTNRPALQIGRPAFLATSIITLYIGLTYLPFAEATAIGFMAPFFIVLLAAPLLGERVGLHRWLAVIAGLVGVIVIVRPGGGIWHWAASMPLIGAACFAGYQLVTRFMAATERPETTLFYTGLGGLLWTSLIVPFFWMPLTPLHWAVFAGTGVMGALAHLCLIGAFQRAEASLLAPFNYTKLVWAAVLGYLAFGDVPSLNTLVGSAIIIAAGIYVFRHESRANL